MISLVLVSFGSGERVTPVPIADDKKSETEVESSTAAPLSASQLLSVMRRRNHEEIHKQEEEDSAQQDEERDMFGFSVSQPDGGGTFASIQSMLVL